MDERIVLMTHDPSWVTAFEMEADLLRERIGDCVVCVSHVGSTAIPSIRAKRIIDIAVESTVYPPSQWIIDQLGSMQYSHRGESGVPGRVWFTKGSPRQFNLHWCPENGDVALAMIKFRDAMRHNVNLAREYELLKVDAAGRLSVDSAEYADKKTEFVAKVLAE